MFGFPRVLGVRRPWLFCNYSFPAILLILTAAANDPVSAITDWSLLSPWRLSPDSVIFSSEARLTSELRVFKINIRLVTRARGARHRHSEPSHFELVFVFSFFFHVLFHFWLCLFLAVSQIERTMRWAGHVARIEVCVPKMLVIKPK